MKTKQYLQTIAVMLVILFGGTTTAWAWNFNEKGLSDEGGGTYNFRYTQNSFGYYVNKNERAISSDDMKWFKTNTFFDTDKDQYYWEVEERICFGHIVDYGESEWKKTEVTGEILVQTGDNVWHKIGTYKWAKSDKSYVSYSLTDKSYGDVYVSDVNTGNGHVKVRYWPGNTAYQQGVKMIALKNYLVFKGDRGFGPYQYEKALDMSSLNATKPMAKAEYSWDEDGNIVATVTGAKDLTNNSRYRDAQYEFKRYFVLANGYGKLEYTTVAMKDMDRVAKNNGKADFTYVIDWTYVYGGKNLHEGCFTMPVLINSNSSFWVNYSSSDGFTNYSGLRYFQPTAPDTIQPYTRPENVRAEFNKWDKSVTIQWNKREKAKCWSNGGTRFDVPCRTDGQWYILRYDNGRPATDYKMLGSVNGNVSNLSFTDTDVDYDREYVYRVVFLPDILDDKYSNKLTSLPGQAERHNSADLWEEGKASTLMEVPVILTQDRTDDRGIHLVWEYNVQTQGCEWRIDKHRLGSTTWNPVITLGVDTKQSMADYLEEGGSVCEPYVYRIAVNINGKELRSDTLVCNLPAGAYISDVKASTGTDEKSVTVKWKVARPGDDDIWFRVMRRIIGSDDWTVLTDEIHGHAAEYEYKDVNVMAGSYYEYSVEAYGAKCEEQLVQTDRVVTPGFSQAKGTITGHISYGTGTAVSGVRVNLVKSSADESTDAKQFLSRYIEGEGKGLQWTADAEKYANVINGQQELTLQLWVKPVAKQDETTQRLLCLNGALELGLTCGDGEHWRLYAIDCSLNDGSSTAVTEFPDFIFDPYQFTHIAAVYRSGSWTFYMGTDTLHTATMSVEDPGWSAFSAGSGSVAAQPTLAIGGSLSPLASHPSTPFRGYVDDVRLWRIALTEKEINSNYTRILSGTDNGLILYWPLDEGINVRHYAFDVANQDGLYQLNHPEVGINAEPSAIVPEQLGLYGVTDIEGDYIIRGIPFQQGGTNYKVVPELGIHEFNPNTRSMFVSPTSLTANNIDFEDVSSFPMSGHIYYAGTNVPAEGIKFYVDGELVTANGEIKQTDSNGYYEISVPIGNHYVEAKAEGHKMVDGGRFPTRGVYNFDRATQYDFADSTLVNYVGRVSGGLRNDTLAVGFGASNNNIGVATVTLKLNNESFSFNCKDDHISDATAERTWDSDTTSIRSRAWTGTGFDSKYIYIQTDSETGEFSALLPPLKYLTKSVRVDNNSEIEFTSLPEVDLTNVTQVLSDSLLMEAGRGDSIYHYYSYNTKTVHTFFAEPRLEVSQKRVNSDGSAPAGVFGLHEINDFTDDFGTTDITNIWYIEGGEVKYRFGYPLYRTGDKVVMSLYGYEPYVNYDRGTPVIDNIPMSGQKIIVTNEMSNNQMVVARVTDEELGLEPGEIYDVKSNEVVLGSDGRNEFTWTAGFPNIVSPYTRQLSMNYERNGRTRLWEGMNAIVLGLLNTGTNFVTIGPDFVTMILRDAPGSNGKTAWTRGHSKTKMSFSSDGWYDDTKFTHDWSAGVGVWVSTGLGVAMTQESEEWGVYGGGIHISAEVGSQDTKTWTTSTTETISTTAHNNYNMANVTNPSAKGDVFIGASLNFIIGDCRKLGLFRDGEDAPVKIDLRDSKSIGDSIRTTFMYSAYELENVMIPKWKETRNAMFTFVGSEPEAKAYENHTDKCVYVCWLDKDSEVLQNDSVGDYRQVAPAEAEGYFPDSVQWCNDQIKSWKKQLAANEEDKVKAMKNSKYFKKNISFDGLAGYNYTSKLDTTYQHKSYESHHIGGIIKFGSALEMKNGVLFKNNTMVETENGWSHQNSDTDYDDNTDDFAQFDYSMVDGNAGTDFSVNIYSSPAGWSDIFSIVAGQSYNPWEGPATTEHYEAGKHTLQNGTQRMEQPDIKISTDGNIGAKSATLTDVPSGQEAQFTLHLTNNSMVNMGFSFIYNVLVLEDQNNEGLSVYMDGFPANGRGVYVSQGETITKIIKVKQTDQSRLDYEGVKIRFVSQYQPAIIYDEVTLNIHFKPSSSPIDLAVSEPILNIETLISNDSCAVLKLQNYDRQFKNLKYIGVQYRYEGSTLWNTIHTYVANKADSLNESYSLLPNRSDVTFRYNMMDDNMFPQGIYHFRAFTTTPYGENPNDAAIVYSKEVDVVKDNVRPRNLTTPMPTNGILGYGDDMAIEFNEDIVPGYVSDKNIIVTAKLNNQPVQHEVAKRLAPYGDTQRTVNPIFLNGDFSVDCWMKWLDAGTILQLGKGQFALGVDADGHIVASIAGAEAVSQDIVPKDKWIYLVLSYKTDDKTFSALAQYDETTLRLFSNYQVGDAAVQAVSYSDDNYLYLGNMYGAMHDLSFFSIYRDVNEAAATKYVAKDGYVYGLQNYWPMDEGHGFIAADSRHTHDFEVNDTWVRDNVNYALGLEDEEGLLADISQINTSPGDSYAIEMWLHPDTFGCSSGEKIIFETGTTNSNRLQLRMNERDDYVLRYGTSEQVVASHEFTDYYWGHIALNVVRGQTASFYYNGQRMATINEREIPPMEGAAMTLVKGMGINTIIDEVRIWKATLSESHIQNNIYNCIDTTDVYSRGLVAYYPFEKAGKLNGVETMIPTMEDMAPNTQHLTPNTLQGNGTSLLYAPPVKNAPRETRLNATPLASERKVIINLSSSAAGVKPSEIEGTTLNITVDKIHDIHGNESLPIRWTAYVQKNTLKWGKDSVNIIKRYGDGYTFDVDITNKGGMTEYYTLYNMPQWLSLVSGLDGETVEHTGDIAPLKTKTLRFRVSPLVAVGNYDVTIGLQGNDGIMEPLRIVMMVRGEKPAWSVDPSKYENNMSIVGQIYINGILMGNSESMLAAFIGNECRGIASPKQVRGAAYVAMSVYGTAQQEVNGEMKDLDMGKPLTFRIWDASTGIAYTNVNTVLDGSPVEAITFDPMQNYGTFDSPAIFTKSNSVEQPIDLKAGWNWMSLGVEPENGEPSVVFRDLTSWNVRMKDQGTGSAYCNGTYWAGSLDYIHANTMYKMLLSRLSKSKDLPQPLSVIGNPVKLSETPVMLKEGWNWIAYTPTTTMTLDEALAAANPQIGDEVKSQTGFAYYSVYGWEGNLEALESGKGYLYHSLDTQTKTFVYPTPSASSRVQRRSPLRGDETLSGSSLFTLFTPIAPTAYPDNMSMVIMLTDNGSPVTDAEVSAFVDGECRAAATQHPTSNIQHSPLYYLLISGEGSGQPMELRVAINGQVHTLVGAESGLTYSSNGNIGTPWEPFVIDISGVITGIANVNTGYVPGVWYTLQGIRIGTNKPTASGVYLYNGQKKVIKKSTN